MSLSAIQARNQAIGAANEFTKNYVGEKVDNQFSTASGDFITVNDSVDGNIVELGVKGNSFQKTYSGKNLFDCNTMFPASGEKNGITLTNNGDGSYSLNGTATADSQISVNFSHEDTVKFFKYGAGVYTLSVKDAVKDANVNAFQCTLYKYDGTNTIYNWHVNSTKKSSSYNIKQEMLDNENFFIAFMFWVKSGATVNQTFYPQLEFGSEATEYEAYCGGVPSPNPNYPQKINSVGDDGSLVIKSCGKNLIPYPYYTKSFEKNNVTFTVNNDGSIKVVADNTTEETPFIIISSGDPIILNKGTYHIEQPVDYKITRLFFRVYNYTTGEFVRVVDYNRDFTFTLEEDNQKIAMNLIIRGGQTCDLMVYPMLVKVAEDGTYSTEYEPYKGSTTTIPLSEPLRAIGDVKDEITYQDGKWGVLRRIKKLVADTPKLINPDGALTGTTYDILVNFEFDAQDSYNAVNKISDMSKHIFRNFQSINIWDKDECGVYISWAGSTSARLSSSICGSTLDEVKAYFKNNPLIGQYVLATPVFEPFADQTLPYLSTYDGVTNISNDDALSAEMTVKYPTTDASGVGSKNESRIAELSKDLGDLTFSASGTTLTITDGTHTWTLESNS